MFDVTAGRCWKQIGEDDTLQGEHDATSDLQMGYVAETGMCSYPH